MTLRAALLLVLAAGAACADEVGDLEGDAGALADAGGAASDGGRAGTDGESDAGLSDAGLVDDDPFAPRPDTSEGLTNVSTNLRALLENGALDTACEDYARDPSDRRKRLLCGKAMFFYEDFGTGGIPALLIDFLTENFPAEVGPGFERMGMVADPYSRERRPLGLAPGEPTGAVDNLVFTCAACHFAALSDGRYAVGAPNFDYDYGGQILAIGLVPAAAAPGFDTAEHAPSALAKVQPLLDRLSGDTGLRIRLLVNLIPLLGQTQPTLTLEQEAQYASWPKGTMDFLIDPLPLDDGVHTVSKIIDLWDLPDEAELERVGQPHALLAWSGVGPSLMRFLETFVAIGGGDTAAWTPERLLPLAEYIESLRSPANLNPPSGDPLGRGAELFRRDCLGCHGGPRGGGDRVYTFAEMGTDDTLRDWGAPDAEGNYCCDLSYRGEQATYGVKSPRLSGLWAKPRLLHNGGVVGLEALFCLDGPRPPVTLDGLGAQGHEDLCTTYDPNQKAALIDYLRNL
ncbi:MAG: hypothetical protein AAFZ18_13805 [Myxococcota bacterium]